MLRFPLRFFSVALPRLDAAPARKIPKSIYSVKLAARQQMPENSTRSKRRAIRRRELRLKSQIIRDVNTLKQHRIKTMSFRVDPVLGSKNCSFIRTMNEYVRDPEQLAHGYDRAEFEKLMYGAQKAAVDASIGGEAVVNKVVSVEEKKRKALLTILHNKNADNPDRRKKAIEYARREFQRFDGDTGSAEVQAAVLTVKIHFAMHNIIDAFKDKQRIQRIRQAVQGRQKLLKYLKKNNPERYFYTIEKLGLTDDVVCNEFSMSKAYMDEYKVFGEKQQTKETPSMKRRKQKIIDLENRVNEYHRVARLNHEKFQSRNL